MAAALEMHAALLEKLRPMLRTLAWPAGRAMGAVTIEYQDGRPVCFRFQATSELSKDPRDALAVSRVQPLGRDAARLVACGTPAFGSVTVSLWAGTLRGVDVSTRYRTADNKTSRAR